MTGAPLAGTEVFEWIALRRVSRGGVTKVGHRWLASGRPVPVCVADALTRLLASGLVIQLTPSAGDVSRAILTSIGHDRYEQLLHRALQMPAAQFLALCQRFIDGDPNPARDTPLPD